MVEQAEQFKTLTGGAINPKNVKVRPKIKKRKDEKVEEAEELKVKSGGAIRKSALKKRKKVGIKRFHDPIHKHLHHNLSGRGGKLDPPYVRKKMQELMQGFHPAVWQSYIKGKVHDLPEDRQYHHGPPIKATRPDPRPTVVDTGGSLAALHHSENGVLTSVDTTFYSHFEVV